MRCLINDIIQSCLRRKKQAEVIHRYLRMKHQIHIDAKSVIGRINAIKMNYNFR